MAFASKNILQGLLASIGAVSFFATEIIIIFVLITEGNWHGLFGSNLGPVIGFGALLLLELPLMNIFIILWPLSYFRRVGQ